MPGFQDFLGALQLGMGLAGGFAHQATQERQRNEASQLALLKILKDDEHDLVEVGPDELGSTSALSALFGQQPPGAGSFRIGNRGFKVVPKKAFNAEDLLGPDTSTLATSTTPRPAARERTLPELNPFGAPAPATPVPTAPASKPQASLNDKAPHQYATLAAQIAHREGVPAELVPYFVANVSAESNFDPNAESPKGAQGLTQLMPDTAKRYKVTNVFDPEENLTGGARYFRFLAERYGNDPDKTVAAYNAGEGAVDQYGGVPPYNETRAHVKIVRSRAPQYAQFANLVADASSTATPPASTVPPSAITPGQSAPTASSTPEQDAAYRAQNTQGSAPVREVVGTGVGTAQQEGAPQLTDVSLGILPGAQPGYPGRKIIQHADGTNYSTHYNIVTNIAGKDYIVPTIFNGKLVSPDEARQIAIQNKLIDPDTGNPFPLETAPSKTGMGPVEKQEHDRLEKDAEQSLSQTPQGQEFLRRRGGEQKPAGSSETQLTSPVTPVAQKESGTPPVSQDITFESPVETLVQRQRRVASQSVRAFSGLPQTRENQLKIRQAIIAANKTAEDDYNSELRETRAQVKAFLVDEHDPRLRKAAQNVRNYAQFEELLDYQKNTPKSNLPAQAAEHLRTEMTKGTKQGDDAAIKVYQELSKADYSRDVINEVLETSGYKDAKGLARRVKEHEATQESDRTKTAEGIAKAVALWNKEGEKSADKVTGILKEYKQDDTAIPSLHAFNKKTAEKEGDPLASIAEGALRDEVRRTLGYDGKTATDYGKLSPQEQSAYLDRSKSNLQAAKRGEAQWGLNEDRTYKETQKTADRLYEEKKLTAQRDYEERNEQRKHDRDRAEKLGDVTAKNTYDEAQTKAEREYKETQLVLEQEYKRGEEERLHARGQTDKTSAMANAQKILDEGERRVHSLAIDASQNIMNRGGTKEEAFNTMQDIYKDGFPRVYNEATAALTAVGLTPASLPTLQDKIQQIGETRKREQTVADRDEERRYQRVLNDTFKATPELSEELTKMKAQKQGEIPAEMTTDEYVKLFPEEITLARQNIQKRKEGEVTRETAAREQAQAEGPLKQTEITKYINPLTGERAKPTVHGKPVTALDLQSANMIPLDPAAQQAVTSRLTILDSLKDMRVLAFGGTDERGVVHPGVFKVPSGFTARGKATVGAYLDTLRQDTQAGIDLVRLRALQEGLLSVYARGIGSEKGNISNYDEQRIMKLFPTVALSGISFQSAEPLARQLYDQIENQATGPLSRIIGNGAPAGVAVPAPQKQQTSSPPVQTPGLRKETHDYLFEPVRP